MDIRNEIRNVANKKILFTQHALDQMSKPERFISEEEILFVVREGEMIEDYPDDTRGHSCLMAAITQSQRVIHVVCAPKYDYLAIVTAYVPNSKAWDVTLKKRRR